MLNTCLDLGFTTNPAKTTQPTTTLELLGIELHSIKQEAQIIQVRLSETLDLLQSWTTKRTCTKRQLQSLSWQTQLYLFGLPAQKGLPSPPHLPQQIVFQRPSSVADIPI